MDNVSFGKSSGDNDERFSRTDEVCSIGGGAGLDFIMIFIGKAFVMLSTIVSERKINKFEGMDGKYAKWMLNIIK